MGSDYSARVDLIRNLVFLPGSPPPSLHHLNPLKVPVPLVKREMSCDCYGSGLQRTL